MKSRLIRCPWITDKGICGAEKQTAHMQLWYDDGYRSIHCTKCKHMSRSTHWQCHHGIRWHQCIEHRQDPSEHQTNRRKNGQPEDIARGQLDHGTLLSADRPEPKTKKPRVNRIAIRFMGQKRIVQSENPQRVNLDWSKCPRLAAKFPHLHNYADVQTEECEEHTEPITSESVGRVSERQTVPSTAITQPCAGSGTPSVVSAVQVTRRKFRYPDRGAALSSGSHRSFLPTEGVSKEGGCADGSNNRADDQRSKLL